MLESVAVNEEAPVRPPNILECLDEVLPVVQVSRLGLVLDFDGTISELVQNPRDAVISDQCASALRQLIPAIALVSVVSGRPASDLHQRVGLEGAVYVGHHGAEFLAGDRPETVPEAAEYVERIREVFEALREASNPAGVYWENNELSATVHFRQATNPDEAQESIQRVLGSLPRASDVEAFWGKLVLELRAPVGIDKGSALRKLAAEHALDGVIFLGDDTTDIDALKMLRELRRESTLRGVGVGVVYEDSPEELYAVADYTLRGVKHVGAFLRWLDSVAASL